MNSLSMVATTCSIFVICGLWLLPPQTSTEIQKNDDAIVTAQDDDAISRRDFMRTKLMYSQNILEGLTMGDFVAVQKAVEEVQKVTSAARWVAIDSEQYRKYTREFEFSTGRLLDAAKTKNIDATALRFYDMSTRCIDCHKHIRKAGYRM